MSEWVSDKHCQWSDSGPIIKAEKNSRIILLSICIYVLHDHHMNAIDELLYFLHFFIFVILFVFFHIFYISIFCLTRPPQGGSRRENKKLLRANETGTGRLLADHRCCKGQNLRNTTALCVKTSKRRHIWNSKVFTYLLGRGLKTKSWNIKT